MNFIYDNAKYLFAIKEINWVSDAIKVCLLDGSVSGYLGGQTARETHENFSDVSDFVLTGTTSIVHLLNRTADNYGVKKGILNASDVTLTAITAGQTVGYICVFKDSSGNTGNQAPTNPATSPLILCFDSGYGLGGGTNGSDIEIQWNPEFGMFRL